MYEVNKILKNNFLVIINYKYIYKSQLLIIQN